MTATEVYPSLQITFDTWKKCIALLKAESMYGFGAEVNSSTDEAVQVKLSEALEIEARETMFYAKKTLEALLEGSADFVLYGYVSEIFFIANQFATQQYYDWPAEDLLKIIHKYDSTNK